MIYRLEHIIDKFIFDYIFDGSIPTGKKIILIGEGYKNKYQVPHHKMSMFRGMFGLEINDCTLILQRWLRDNAGDPNAVISRSV